MPTTRVLVTSEEEKKKDLQLIDNRPINTLPQHHIGKSSILGNAIYTLEKPTKNRQCSEHKTS